MALDKLNTRRYRGQRERVFSRDGRLCAVCGTDEGEMHIDHIIPRKHGGTHDMDNLRVLCKSCNLRKGTLNDGVFLGRTATPPVFPALLSPTQSEPMLDSPFTTRPNTDR
ncbi:HNHc domain containing protein [uncultured Caudovirales phage]|uniref:HNHc domain containing protein n=1 Tax=uncultured Caudovirales phage TaxID=2100421 RepID=A0A6J5PEN1_9CAUD|nr:HNHc domain containing protein [uncultured Caudovirales phage]CAB4180068.1 HNHc domain containing protein [uncultured Caudovirales phage]CAB4194147.1 HNHc domain containing protein [uncultured Caudovirales phage]